MRHDIAVIDEHPFARLKAFDAHRLLFFHMQRLFDPAGNRLHLTVGSAARDDEVVGKRL